VLIGNGMLIDKALLTRLGQHWNNFVRQECVGLSTTADGFGALAALPDGYGPGRAFWMPRIAGAMSAVNAPGMSFSGAGSGAMGLPSSGSTSFSFNFSPAAGELIVSGIGSASFALTATGSLLATLTTTGAASFALTATATPGALAWGAGATSITVTGTLTPYARGFMSGSTEGGALTASSIAGAVWSQVIEAGFTAEQIVRLLAAHAAGAATGLEGANPQFTGLDGVTVRIDGAYSAGTRTIDALNGG
jgi:hypothetical protein